MDAVASGSVRVAGDAAGYMLYWGCVDAVPVVDVMSQSWSCERCDVMWLYGIWYRRKEEAKAGLSIALDQISFSFFRRRQSSACLFGPNAEAEVGDVT